MESTQSIVEVKSGADMEAWRERSVTVNNDEPLFRLLYPSLRRFSAVVAPRGADPDDLVQEALVRVLEKCALGDLDDPGRYLQLVIVRLASNERRRRAREDSAVLRMPHKPKTVTIASRSSIGEMLEELQPRDRALLYLSVVEDQSADAIAERLQMTVPAVRMAKSRALARLRNTNGEDADV